MEKKITSLTRRNLFYEIMGLDKIEGKLNLISFIELIWDIDKMPSTDRRYNNAKTDIYIHVLHFNDWDLEYLFFDYLDIIGCDDNTFIKFLEATTHPEVRTNKEEQEKYVIEINKHLTGDGFRMDATNEMSGYPIYDVIKIKSGIPGEIKNLIFAANGYKPEIVLKDAVNNVIEIVRNQEYCLVYDRNIPSTGLLWRDLANWWGETQQLEGTEWEIEKNLYDRLYSSLTSPPEKYFFEEYFRVLQPLLKEKLPALIPQVYLHYDPYTQKNLRGIKRLNRERMDFLLLLENRERVVLELDGIQHYADSNKKADVRRYAEMVQEDRELKLKGYEVYRFGGVEFTIAESSKICADFFQRLFKKHGYF